jgi:hypothetical protein
MSVVLHRDPPSVPLGSFELESVLELRILDQGEEHLSSYIARSVRALLLERYGNEEWIDTVESMIRAAFIDPVPSLLIDERKVAYGTVRVTWRPRSEVGAALYLAVNDAHLLVRSVRPVLPFGLAFPRRVRLVGRRELTLEHGGEVLARVSSEGTASTSGDVNSKASGGGRRGA